MNNIFSAKHLDSLNSLDLVQGAAIQGVKFTSSFDASSERFFVEAKRDMVSKSNFVIVDFDTWASISNAVVVGNGGGIVVMSYNSFKIAQDSADLVGFNLSRLRAIQGVSWIAIGSEMRQVVSFLNGLDVVENLSGMEASGVLRLKSGNGVNWCRVDGSARHAVWLK